MDTPQWVMLAYRLPRTPSTPRIALWRRFRRLGVVQVVDGVVALPAGADTREQIDWLAEDIVQAGGEATIWIAQPATAAQHRSLAATMTERIDEEYRAIVVQASGARASSARDRRRTLARLRRELRRVGARQYFPTDQATVARAAVERLAEATTSAAA